MSKKYVTQAKGLKKYGLITVEGLAALLKDGMVRLCRKDLKRAQQELTERLKRAEDERLPPMAPR